MDRFDAFISYSHAADGRLAPAVETGLTRLAKSVFQRRALRVFRDETGLSTNPHLWGSIEDAIQASDWFVLLASPESAGSEWVEREVVTWLRHGSLDRVLVVVTGGDLAFRDDGGADPGRTTCLPQAMVDALESEPRWLDLRWAREDDQLDLRNGRFRAAIADLAAPIHGIAKDDLESEDVRQQKRARRLGVGGVAAVAVLFVVSAVAALIAFDQRDRADSEANSALARSMAAQATAVANRDIGLSLLLAAEGFRRDPTLDTQNGLLTALDAGRLFTDLDAGLPPVADLEVGADGATLYILTLTGDVLTYEPDTLTQIGEPVATGIVDPFALDVSRSGGLLAINGGEGTDIIDLRSGEVVADNLGGVSALPALSPDGTRVALAYLSDHVVEVYDVKTGAATLTLETESEPVAVFLTDGRLAVQEIGLRVITVYDTSTDAARIETTRDLVPAGQSLKVSPDGRLLMAGGLEGTVVLLDTETLEFVSPVVASRGSRTVDFAFSRDSSLVQMSGDDGSATVIDTETGATVVVMAGMEGGLTSEFIGDRELVSASYTDGGSTTWRADGGALIADSYEFGEGVTSIRVLGADRWMLTSVVESMGSVSIVDPMDIDEPIVTRSYEGFVLNADVSLDAELVAVNVRVPDEEVGVAGRVHLLRLDDLSEVSALDVGKSIVSNVAFSPDGSELAVGFSDGRLAVFAAATGAPLLEPIVADGLCCLGTIVWSGDGERLHAGGQDGILRTFDTSTWRQIGDHRLTENFALRLSEISPDGTMVVVASESGEVILADARTGEPIGEPFVNAGTQLQRAVLLPGGAVVAAVSRDGALRLWDVASRRVLGPALNAHVGLSLALESVDDNVLLTGGFDDGLVFAWDLDPERWFDLACSLAGRNLTRVEWGTLVGGPYRSTCEQWSAPE